MPKANQAALEFLSTRHSYPARTLGLPVPDDALLEYLLTLATRTPDHGKLAPWRFIVLKKAALTRLSGLAKVHADSCGADATKRTKAHGQFDFGNLAVVVISSPKDIERIPLSEQVLSTGAVCAALVNAAQALGFGGCWLSGWLSHDSDFIQSAFGLSAHETVAGLVHLGTPKQKSPETIRPETTNITQWMTE
jgi:nitroreductase